MPGVFVQTDVLIISASASDLMSGIAAGKRGRQVIVLDHASKAGKKILMSGGWLGAIIFNGPGHRDGTQARLFS